jgi:hypothetical protein
MSTLIINTPSGKVKETKQSFEKTFKSCVGVGFAMSSVTLLKALKCTKVHILDTDGNSIAGPANAIFAMEKPAKLRNILRFRRM